MTKNTNQQPAGWIVSLHAGGKNVDEAARTVRRFLAWVLGRKRVQRGARYEVTVGGHSDEPRIDTYVLVGGGEWGEEVDDGVWRFDVYVATDHPAGPNMFGPYMWDGDTLHLVDDSPATSWGIVSADAYYVGEYDIDLWLASDHRPRRLAAGQVAAVARDCAPGRAPALILLASLAGTVLDEEMFSPMVVGEAVLSVFDTHEYSYLAEGMGQLADMPYEERALLARMVDELVRENGLVEDVFGGAVTA